MLIDEFLPKYQFSEQHTIQIAASAEKIMNIAIHDNDPSDKITKTFMMIREFPTKLLSIFHQEAKKTQKPFGLHSFLLLGQNENKEVAFGLTGKFWQLNFGLVNLMTPTEFLEFSKINTPQLVINFSIQETEGGHCILSTETRVFCPDRKSRILFSPYWYLIRIASGMIRKKMLLQVKQKAELY